MRGFKHRKTIADVGAGSDAETADLGRGGVGDVVAVEVGGGEDGVVGRPDDDLLEDGVGDAVIDEDLLLPCAVAVGLADGVEHAFDLGVEIVAEFLVAEFEAGLDEGGILFNGDIGVGVDVAEDPAFALGDHVLTELLDGDFIAPLAECALSELLDVALVDEGDGLAAHLKRVLDGVADQALGGEDADGLDADAGVGANLFLAALEQVFIDEFNKAGGVGRPLFELDAGVHVLRVLTEDDDVDLFRMLHGAGHALVVLDRAHTGVKIEQLAEGHVQRPDAAADGRGERSLDGDSQIARGGYGVIRQPGGELAEGLLAGEDFKPLDLALAAVGLFDCCVKDALRGLPDVTAGAVAFNERDDGMVRNFKLAVFVVDGLPVFGQFEPVVCGLHGFQGSSFVASSRRRLPPAN